MNNIIKYLLSGILIIQSFIAPISIAVSEEVSLPTDSPIKVTVNDSHEAVLSDKELSFSIMIDDQTVSSEEIASINKETYRVFFEPGMTYESSASPITVTNDHQVLEYEMVGDKKEPVKLQFKLLPDQLKNNQARLYIEKDDGVLVTLSNEVLIQYEKSKEEVLKEDVLDEKGHASSSTESSESKKEMNDAQNEEVKVTNQPTLEESKEEKNEVNKEVNTIKPRTFDTSVALENDMAVSNPLPKDITLDQYFAEYYQVPRAQEPGVYESVEVDLKQKYESGELASEAFAMVYDTADYNKAITSTSVRVLLLMDSFIVTTSPSNWAANTVYVIEGNNQLLDYRATRSDFYGAGVEVIVQNLNTYHRDFYGFVRATGAKAKQKFHNVSDYGNQTLSSQAIPVTISGNFVNRFTANSYVSPIDGTTFTGGNSVTLQQNFESSNIEFLAGSETILETYDATNIDLTAAGDVILYENAKLNLIAGNKTNNTGEGLSGHAISARYSSNFIMKKNSEISYTYTNTGNNNRNSWGILYFYSTGTFTMEDGAKMYVNKDSHSGTYGLIHFNTSGSFNLSKSSLIEMNISDTSVGAIAINLTAANATFNISDNSQLLLNMESTGTGTNPIINLGSRAKFDIDSGSTVEVNANGYQRNILKMGNGLSATNMTMFHVGENATLNINATGRKNTDANSDVVSVGNYSSFIVDRLGNFILSANKARYIFNVGLNSKFQFSDANRVSFGFTENPNNSVSALIFMSGSAGTFNIDVQHVKAWSRSNEALNPDAPDFSWNPMFGMVIPYSSAVVTNSKIQGESMTQEIAQNFKDNFNTGTSTGFQRLVFEFIPDVEVTIDNELMDTPENPNAMTVKGSTNAGAYVRLSDEVTSGGYSSFPTENNTIESPIELDENYTVKADENGKFSFEVAKELAPFVAGNKVKAYSFLNGKSATDEKTVMDKTAPTGKIYSQYLLENSAVPEPEKFVRELKDSNPNTTVSLSYTLETEQALPNYLTKEGVYDIYLTAVDTAGNIAEFSSKLYVITKTEGISAKDITWTTKEVEGWTSEEFKQQIITSIQADAYKILDGDYHDLTDKIIYDTSGVIPEFGVYKVMLSVSEADSGVVGGLSTIVTLTINSVGPTKPVDPTSPETGKEPEEGLENGGTTNAEGVLRLDYAPTGITFGEVPFSYQAMRYQAIKQIGDKSQPLSKQWLQVSDGRADENGWEVKSSLTAFHSTTGEVLKGATLVLPKGTIYSESVGEITDETKIIGHKVELSSDGQSKTLVETKDLNEQNIGKKITTYVWNPEEVILEVPGGQAKVDETYQAEVSWSLISSPNY
ncbi:WxL domain-containing protein [Vagococcus xieshaowenii]|uniref:WxL domain-containing protein n=1 Tax=Vagococcus xieshaowenii TaxID=2562451 RepID=A0AAJ5JMM7_9ENTE|nr:WxL domain-containing protein [Vagococcus xieshaowenii]QCA29545.1 WxL domain-containing protein [Vagococcus xieshaowenii]TFZ42661.1 WxL domain-containing protein [Vagococcus xieshaowenii]